MDIIAAGELVRHAYANTLLNVSHRFDVGGAQAFFLDDETLVIPGSNEISDYPEFNLDISKIKGDSGRFYHRGFLRHAQLVFTFAKGLQPKFVIGHSLGGASAQIVGSSLGIPTIAFASPKVLSGAKKVRGEHHVVNYQRMDDPICFMPPGKKKFRHIGKTYWMAPNTLDIGFNHKVLEYIKIIKAARTNPKLPQRWPV
ncbi:hypothetical protein GCM10008927_17170 [Amylibacter ulvae]|uniref:Fungal lipase-like domain-containing protein n=1 Tax=Paramylibacter ulvae TaxID=1651968 RepID=A0ABQ3D259_9RHOB|nr:hypothetical protein [Amylibacter ulvae]GHA52337.1 hypothetical protein GCM10008927_17170 [Amylibacter ulvae]